MRLGYADRAVPVLREAVQANASDAATNGRLAEALLDLAAQADNKRTKDALYGEALQIAERVLTLQPNEYESYNLVGQAALGAQDYGRAERSFRKVLAQRPDHCWAMANLGKTYMAQERWAEAETTFTEATVCAPRLVVAFENLGHVQQKQIKLPQAIQSYEAAQKIKQSDAVARAIATCKQDLERYGVPEGPTLNAEIETKKRYEEAIRKFKESGFKRKADQ